MHRPIPCLPVCLALATGLAAQRVAEFEPNDTFAQAQLLTAGTHVTATLVAGEQDWFSFVLTAPAEVHLRTSGNFNPNSSVDTAVLLYDATGTVRLAWDDNSAGTQSDLGVNLPAGFYHAMVIGKLATTAGPYGLDFVVLQAATIQTVEGPEPNGDPLTGVPTPITLGDTVAGELSSPTDSDWFTFTLTDRAIVQAICYDDGGVPQLDNVLLRFHQETAPGVFTALGTSSTIGTSHRAFNLGHPTTLAAGTYAIEVAAGTAAAGTPPLDYVKTGKYALRTRLITMSSPSVIAEGPEPNNIPLQVPFFSLGDTLSGNCSGQNEEDWWGFTISGPTTVAFMSDLAGTSTPIVDTTVKIYDENGTSITSASSGGPNSHGRLVHTLPRAGIYYFAVAGGVFAATGDYVVHTGSTEPMFVSATWSETPPSTNACPGSNALRPSLRRAATEAPQVGSTFVVKVGNTLPNAIVVPFFGFSRTVANGSTPLPYDLAPLGAPGCFVRVDPAITTLVVTDGAGEGWIDFVLPTPLATRGTAWFMQALVLDATNNALGASVTNDVSMVIGDRSY